MAGMSKLAQARWAQTQNRLNSLEKQVKKLFSLVNEKQEAQDADFQMDLLMQISPEVMGTVKHLLLTRGLDPEKASKVMDYLIHFADSHREVL